jgi:hypothetical protein
MLSTSGSLVSVGTPSSSEYFTFPLLPTTLSGATP